MANPPKPWKVEYAKSGRSSCRSCKSNIEKEALRLGKMVQSSQFDGFMPMWNHASCVLRKANQIKSLDDVEGIESLRWEDQQKIRKYVEEGVGSGSSSKSNVTSAEYGIEVSQTSRATCRHCSKKIMKGEVRISAKPDGQGTKGLAWHHANCFLDLSPSTQVEKLSGWGNLTVSDQGAVKALVNVPSTTKNGTKAAVQENKEMPAQQSTSKAGTKRKNIGGVESSKVGKFEGDVSTSRAASVASSNNLPDEHASDLESKLEAQTKELWALKDDLKKHVTTAELREMLEANGQDSTGSELDLRDHCADGMMFGALGRCPICSGPLRYSGGIYRCRGYQSAWSKCSYSTREPERLKGKWKIPEETNSQYLVKWFKSQRTKKPIRVLPPRTSNSPASSQASKSPCQSSKSENLGDLRVSFSRLPKESKEEWKRKIGEVGGVVHAKINKETNCLVLGGVPDDPDAEMRKARKMKVPIVREDYLVDCFKRQKKLPFDLYKVEAVGESSSMVTIKVKGQSAVHEASGMQDTGHILEDGKSVYNTTLNMSDLSTGVNRRIRDKMILTAVSSQATVSVVSASAVWMPYGEAFNSEASELCYIYYILQIIQDDKGSDCYVFRKWGRVGNDKIGGSKLEEFSKEDAVCEFKRLFLEKTGNPWEAWEQKQNFQKKPGKFFPLDIDYGVNKQVSEKIGTDADSQLAPALVELMKMLFNVETYRAAMMEFDINMSEMPLGKLSKNNIQKGFEALTEIQNLLNNGAYDPSVKESLIIDASNRFFTVIPSIHPHVIRDEDDFKSKVKMLEALQDIEIASRLVGFDVDSDDSLDEKYKKLRCDIAPLPHDSEDYQLIEKYLHTTHAPTHTDWSLELEEVFSLEREGEFDKFSSYQRKLKNRMLLWHGKLKFSVVKFMPLHTMIYFLVLWEVIGVSELDKCQGLRIAPPEAPATGYMVLSQSLSYFGKGIYFADLVSKSAQYCFTDKKNPVGLMLLSEVGLGEVYELKKAKYMDKPPDGKHSTKGLGKTVPQESDFVKWRDDVTVPCGKPAPSNVRASELMYNEYIVYNTAQISFWGLPGDLSTAAFGYVNDVGKCVKKGHSPDFDRKEIGEKEVMEAVTLGLAIRGKLE
ncbi:poly (ADP-ribose) polymerase 1 [Citrus sinensis]|uniref:Poly (ADP-ribose) polymerase 1 n=1 Tax=Citrus sinensis TaxID=2711 RepID=A0ACB8MIP5_CITSI|nr:poly (ADP-ribose) polymerase 1 [Citrus sinensis]